MKGAVVINRFLEGSSFKEPAEMISNSAKTLGIGMDTYSNMDLSVSVGDADALHAILGDVDFIVFWDKDVRLVKNLEVCGYPVFNCSECIRICDDKSLTHLTLEDWGIPSIKTIISPMSFGNSYEGFEERIMDALHFPLVAKDCFGSFGQQVRMIRNEDELRREMVSGTPKIFQEYIECGGEDLRLEVVGGKVVAAVKRKAAEGDFRSNASNGGTMSAYEPSEEEASLAIEASNAVEADFAGVDIIRTGDGPVVCEVNSNAHIMNLKNATGRDVSRDILEHIVHFLS